MYHRPSAAATEIRGAACDLHSANATSVPTPAWRLTWVLATLKSPDERILVLGFYDRVRPPSDSELRAVELIPDDEALLADFAPAGAGDLPIHGQPIKGAQ